MLAEGNQSVKLVHKYTKWKCSVRKIMKKISSTYFHFWGSVFCYSIWSSAKSSRLAKKKKKARNIFSQARMLIISPVSCQDWLWCSWYHHYWVFALIFLQLLHWRGCAKKVKTEVFIRAERKHLFAKKKKKFKLKTQKWPIWSLCQSLPFNKTNYVCIRIACLLPGCHLML